MNIINKNIQSLFNFLRGATPLWMRKTVGPIIAYVYYIYNTSFNLNKKAVNILSLEKTVDRIISKNLSVIRFGDGEMTLMENDDLEFQERNYELGERLREIIKLNLDGLLICVPNIFSKLSDFNSKSFWFLLHHRFRYEHVWDTILSREQIYGDAYITRPYLNYKNSLKSDVIFKKMLSIWDGRDVVLIEGEKSRLGVGNDLFSNVRTIQRILCPAENAYNKYGAIKREAIKVDKDKLLLISLGPTAKLLAYELFLLGYRVIDIGHIDMEYEMYLRKENKIIKVKYKYFNEINERNPEQCTDAKYLNQIISCIYL